MIYYTIIYEWSVLPVELGKRRVDAALLAARRREDIYIYIYVYMYTHILILILIHIYIERERAREREREL